MSLPTGHAVDAVLALYRQADIVALGERHWAKQDSDFRIRLVQDPRFVEAVDHIVIEAGNALYQDVLDRYVNGDSVPADELRRVWEDTTQPGAWDSRVYRDFLAVVRRVNLQTPDSRRLHGLAGDPAVNWDAIKTPADLRSIPESRDDHAAKLIEREVIEKRKKALLIYGSAHLYRNFPSNILANLGATNKLRVFTVVPIGGPEPEFARFDSFIASSAVPGFVLVRGTRFAALNAGEVLERGTKRVKVVNGTMVATPVFDAPVQLDRLVDACLYFGREPPEFVQPDPSLYENTSYGRELQRRRSVALATP